MIVAAIFGYGKFKAPTSPAAAPRLPAAAVVLDRLRSSPLGKELQPAAAMVVDSGPLRNVPYLSYRAGDLEFNAYGDAERPAGLELGLFGPGDRAAAREALAALLPDPDDRNALKALDLEKGKQSRGGLTFEVTPADAPDAYGAWWVSVYDLRALEAARNPSPDLVEPRPGPPPKKSRPGKSVYRKR